MSKKKKTTTKQIPLLSPENYIRQKSRNLPLGECFVSKEWEESLMADIVITRKHVNGNVSVCFYLVDLGCLGVKDTAYKFNAPFEEIEEIFKKNKEEGIELISIPYELAHNIIYAGLDYAEEYGFIPCKEFTSITRYFLEEDTDDIPLIEIACGGKDGKPLYVNTGFDSPARERQILAQLEKIAGEGNYNYILNVDDFDKYYEEEDDEDEEELDEQDEIKKEINQLSKEEQKSLFFEILFKSAKENSLNKGDLQRISIIASLLSSDITKEEEIVKQYDMFVKKFERDFVEVDELPNSLFTGVQDMNEETIADLFFNTVEALVDDINPKKAIATFRRDIGGLPVADFLELYYLNNKGSKKFYKKIEEDFQKHPHYFLIRLFQRVYGDYTQALSAEILEQFLTDEKQPITQFEAEFFFAFYALYLTMNEQTDLAAILAFEKYIIINLSFLPERSIAELFAITRTAVIQKIAEHIKQAGECIGSF